MLKKKAESLAQSVHMIEGNLSKEIKSPILFSLIPCKTCVSWVLCWSRLQCWDEVVVNTMNCAPSKVLSLVLPSINLHSSIYTVA